jgi:membrane-associated protease RseP (regulator of RpoE activity)
MERTSKHEVLAAIRETFHELPGWQKLITIFAIVAAAPTLGILALLMAFALFPLALAGRFEGDMGKAPLKRAVARRIYDQEARTRRYYAL